MAAIPQWLQPLLRAGVLQDAAQLGTVSYSYRNSITKNSASISSSIIIPISSKPPSKPQIKAKRSPVIKAYAHSIRGLLTPESDLGAAGQALFIASPLQKGIPLGVKDEFMNESIYEHGNSVQSPLSPIYRSGHGNYFGWLNKYVSNVEDVFASSDTNATDKDAAYLQAKRDANDEYEKAVARFEKIQKMDPTVRFQDWMNQYATDYVEACKIRDTLADKLRHSSVKLAKEMLDDAQARLEPKQGNNMPCAVSDVDILRERGTQQEDIVYRPRYYLSGYRSTATRWRDEYYEKAASPEQRFVSFEGLKNKTWAQLGITEPDGDNDIDETPEMDFHITLTYTGLEAFDVKRGLWDVNDFRVLLPQLASTAPPDCHQPIYKTNRLLLAYGVNLIVKLPQSIDPNLASRLRLMPGLVDDLPLTLVDGNELHAQSQTNDAYPVLLAILADRC